MRMNIPLKPRRDAAVATAVAKSRTLLGDQEDRGAVSPPLLD